MVNLAVCTPTLSWVNCNYNYGTQSTLPILCSSGSSVNLLAVTGCYMQGGVNDTATTVACPTTRNVTESVSITIYDPNSYGGSGCTNVTKTFYLRNTGE